MQENQSSKKLVKHVAFQEVEEFLELSHANTNMNIENIQLTQSTEDIVNIVEEDIHQQEMRASETKESMIMVFDEEESNLPHAQQEEKEYDKYEFSGAESEEEVRYHLLQENMIMFDKSNVTVGDVAEMISALSARFNLTFKDFLNA